MSGFIGIGLWERARGTPVLKRRRVRRGQYCERLEDRRLLSTVISPYGGNHGVTQPNPGASGISPTDIAGAVGTNDLLQFTDAQYADLNLTSGVYTHRETPAQFWSRVGISNTTPYDTKAVYDPLIGRFVVAALSGANSTSNKILLAMSIGSQADQGWYGFAFNANSVENGYQTYSDSLSLGADLNGIYLATRNCVVGSGLFVDSSIFATPVTPLLPFPPGSPTLSRWKALYPSNGDWFQPAVNFSSGQTAGTMEYIVAPVLVSGATYLEISSISWSAGVPSYGGASLCATNGAYSPPPNGIQPAGYPQLDAGGEVRVQNAVVSNGSIWTVLSANIGGNAGGVFTQTQLSNLSAVYQVAWLHQAGVDYLYPSIAVNAVGWVTIGATEVSPSMYPSTVLTGRRATDPGNTLCPVTVVEAGAVGYTGAFVPGSSTVAKWGEYSTTFVDPTNNYTFWSIQEDSVSSSVANNWTTWFEEFGLTIGSSGAALQGGGTTIGPAAAASTTTFSSTLLASDGKNDLLIRAQKRHASSHA
jgi:hypothetical protein